MASEAVLEITDANFDEQVAQSDQPVLVDFWADWCQPCKMLAPTIDALADEYQGKIRVGKIDVDSNRDTAIKFQVQGIPMVILFQGGEVVKSWTGALPKKTFVEEIDKVLG
jgi:thioredoxin